MKEKPIIISGNLVDKTGNPIVGYEVQAWDKDLLIDDHLGTTVSGKGGAFSIEFEPEYYQELIFDRKPDIYFKVYDKKNKEYITDQVIWNVDSPTKVLLTLQITVGGGQTPQPDPPQDETTYKGITISGLVDTNRSMLPDGIRVEIVNKLVLSIQKIADVKLDINGNYSANISFKSTENPALQTIVYDKEDKQIGASEIVYDLSERIKLDVLIDTEIASSLPIFDLIGKRIAPLIQDTPIHRLTDDQLSLLASKTDTDDEDLEHFRSAHIINVKEGIRPDITFAWFYFGVRHEMEAIFKTNTSILIGYISQAVQDRVIAPVDEKVVPAIIATIQRKGIAANLDQPILEGGATYNEMLTSSGVKKETIESFTSISHSYAGAIGDFWSSVRNDDNGISANEADTIQFTVQSSSLSLGNMKLANQFIGLKKQKVIQSTRDLVNWESEDWLNFLGQDEEVIPDQIPGSTLADKRESYTTAVMRVLEQSYPTAFLVARISDNDSSDLAVFTSRNTDFEIGETDITSYVNDNSDALSGINNPDAFVADLSRLQVRYMLSPGFDKYKSIGLLENLNIESSFDVRNMSWKQFSREYENQGGSTEMAGVVYEMAGHNVAMMQSVQMNYGPDMVLGTYVTAIPGYWDYLGSEVTQGNPDLETLFGSKDFCECLHCRSIYSPSAYLVDVLQFLLKADTNTASFNDCQEVLFDRRPDLCAIDLNCENTNTAMPYVDLINEIFENAIVLSTTGVVPDYTLNQTTLTSAELLAHPEHVQTEVYDSTLKNAMYPWTLPFDLWTEEGRVYLNHLSISKAEIMDTWEVGGSYAHLVSGDIVSEILQLSIIDREILLGTTAATNKELWGLSSGANFLNTLKMADDFLKYSNLEFDDLKQLLKMNFLNPNGTIELEFDNDAPCDLSKAQLKNITENDLMKIQRFVRLKMKLGWSYLELDIALTALGTTNITDVTLKQLSHAIRLAESLKLPLYQLFTFWGNISTGHVNNESSEHSVYELLFLNKSVLNPVDEAFELKSDLSDLSTLTHRLTDHSATIKAGIGLSNTDLELLISEVLPDDKINLANLSTLYRYVIMAKTLKMSIKSLLVLLDMQDSDPFDSAKTEEAIQFISDYRLLQGSRFSLEELEYLLYKDNDLSTGFGLSESSLSDTLTNLQLELKKIYDENQFVADPQGENTTAKLSTLITEEELNTAVEILEETSDLNLADTTTFIVDVLGLFISDTADATNKLADNTHLDYLSTKQDRYEYVLTDVLDYLINSGTKELLKQHISENLGLDVDVAEEMLFTWLNNPNDATTNVGDVLRTQAFISSTNTSIESADFPDQFDSYTLLYKSAIVLNRFKVSSVELPYLFANAFDPDVAAWAGWFAFNDLPVVANGTPSTQFAELVRMSNLFTFYHNLPASEEQLFEVMKDAFDPASVSTSDDILTQLSELTKWDFDNLKELSDNVFGYAKTDYKDELPLMKIAQCMTLIKLLGTSASEMSGWVTLEINSSKSGEIVHNIKSLYDELEWLNIAKPLRDQLREKQREALTDWLMNNQTGVDSEFDLYNYYLVDPEMSPCMLTSRMRLAMSSVQLFVQRCLMNLETTVEIGNSDLEHWGQWKWMKTYRLWEANRKIFTYPENWIEPELRDNKTSFFKELEQELAQVDINKDTVEVAYTNYLTKLEDVAGMDILGICYAEENSGSKDANYIFGRTVGSPQILYFRKFTTDRTWTAWEKIDIDFEGDHLVPIVYNGKLHILWPIITKATKEASVPSDEDDGEEPEHYYEVQMAWSTYRNGQWAPKRVTKEKIDELGSDHYYGGSTIQFDQGGSRFYLSKNIDSSNNLEINLYASVLATEVYTTNVMPARHFGAFEFTPSMKVTTSGANNSELDQSIMQESDVYNQEYHHSVYHSSRSLEIAGTLELLKNRPQDDYSITFVDFDGIPALGWYPFVYQDTQHTFFFEWDWNIFRYRIHGHEHPYVSDFMNAVAQDGVDGLLDPELGSSGALSTGLRRQQIEEEFFNAKYGPTATLVHEDVPINSIDFSLEGSYSDYNWEVFYHIPMLIADKLSTDQKFEEAQKWYHYIFDPTDTSSEYSIPQRFWKLKPFVEIYDEAADGTPASIQELMELLNEGDSDMEAQVEAWREDPFNPHLIARMRVSAYQKNVVMKYIDNLLQWADMLFRQDTMETTNEATQLYMLAWFILGEKPEMVDGVDPDDMSYCELKEEGIDDFSNAMITLETKLITYFGSRYAAGFDKFKDYMNSPIKDYTSEKLYAKDSLWFDDSQVRNAKYSTKTNTRNVDFKATNINAITAENNDIPKVEKALNTNGASWAEHNYGEIERLVPGVTKDDMGYLDTHPNWEAEVQLIQSLYFCIPHNDKLLGYWDMVEDRMYKLRNCLNIDGVFRQLPLFDPPIDPGALVRGAASGMDLSSVLSDLNASLPNYRFTYMIAKAKEFTSLVERVGSEMLAALEKKDAEALDLMRANHEVELLKAVRQMKELEIDSAQENRNILSENKSMVEAKQRFYENRSRLNTAEGFEIGLMGAGMTVQLVSQIISLTAATTYAIPQVTGGVAGWAGSPVLTVSVGGQQVGNAASQVASALDGVAGLLYQGANLSGIIAGIQRRNEDWDFQMDQAEAEVKIIDQRLELARISYEIAQEGLDNHDKQTEQRKAEYEFRKNKFTNKELYDWMTAQLASVYFQTYQMAYDLAKRAERSYKFELAESNDSFISYGYWDSLKKGLLAGEKLQTDLARMEAAYLEKNKRSYELTKNVSLKMIDPYALVQLRENGSCYFNIPEEILDLDHPGHYMRRIKSVSVTIPCIAGPYNGVNSKLTLLSSEIRKTTEVDAADSSTYPKRTDGTETRFVENLAMIQSIATSNGQNDDGLFVLNFQDEQYLPFEGSGVISSWRLEFPERFRAFDYDTISDVIVSINYTAKDGGAVLRESAEDYLETYVDEQPDTNLDRVFSMRHEFSNDWYKLLNPEETVTDQSVTFALKKSHFPHLFRDRDITGLTMDVILQLKNASLYSNAKKVSLFLEVEEEGESEITLTANTSDTSADYIGGQPSNLNVPVSFEIVADDVNISLSFKETNLITLPEELIEEINGHTRIKTDALQDLLLICKYHTD